MSRKKVLSIVLTLALTLTAVAAVAPGALAASASIIPSQPSGAPNLITAGPTISANDMANSYAYNDGTLDIIGQPPTEYCAEYTLDSTLTNTSEYVISVDFDMPADARYSADHGPIVIFRKNTDGKYLGLWMQGVYCYLRSYTLDADTNTFTAEGGDWKQVSLLADGTKGTLKLHSKADGIWVEVYDENGALQVIDGTATSVSWGIAGGAPAFAISTNGSKASFSNAVVYDPNYETETPESTEGTTTTTTAASPETTVPTVPAIDMTKAPSRSGQTNLLNNAELVLDYDVFEGDDEVISRDGNTIKVALKGETYMAHYDLKNLSAQNAYAFSGTMTVTEPYASYSGARLFIAGSTTGKCYQLAFLEEAAYVLEFENYQNYGKYTPIYTDMTYTYEANTPQKIGYILNGNRLSIFVDGKSICNDLQLPETLTPMLGVSNAVAGWTLSDMELWNMNEKNSNGDNTDDPGSDPTTGVMVPIVAVVSLAAGSTVIIANTRKRRS